MPDETKDAVIRMIKEIAGDVNREPELILNDLREINQTLDMELETTEWELPPGRKTTTAG